MANNEVDPLGHYMEAYNNDPLSRYSKNSVPEEQAQAAYQGLMESRLPTSYYVQVALTKSVFGVTNADLWGGVANSREESKAYYDSIEDKDELRSEAALILAYGGWDRRKVGFLYS